MQILRGSWRSLLIAIAIPVVGLVVFPLARSEQDSEWMRGLRRGNPDARAEQLAALTLPAVCADPALSAQLDAPCRDRKALVWLSGFDQVVLGLALVIPAGIYIAGRACRRDRALLLRLFRPGLRIVNVAAACLILGQGLILVAALYYGFTAFLDRIPAGLIFATAAGALFGSFAVIQTMFRISREVETSVAGHFASREQEPALWSFVDGVAAAAGAAPPDNVIIGLDPTFFVTQSIVRTSNGARPGRSLYLSAPLCRLLDKEELRAICAHEMGHFKGADTEYSIHFYPIFRGAANSIEALVSVSEDNSRGSLALIPAVHLLSFFLSNFAEAEASISRERELHADRVAVETCGAMPLASGLTRIVLHEPAWSDLLAANWQAAAAASVGSSETGPPRVNASRLYVRFAEERARSLDWTEVGARLAGGSVSHPTDSHPPLDLRLSAVGVKLDDLRGLLAKVLPTDPASDLISDLDRREERLTADIQDQVRAASAARNLTFAQLPD